MNLYRLSLVMLGVVTAQSSVLAEEPVMSSTSENAYVEEITLKDETLGFSPQYGVLSFVDNKGEVEGRQLVGLGIDFNGASLFKNSVRDYFFGVSTGAFYSHMGEPSSDFFGGNASQNESQGGANMVLIPADLKVGYNFTNDFRASVRGGGNIIYRSIGNSANLGEGSTSGNALWRVYPNVGADFEWQVSRYVSLMARPDLTIAPNDNLFMGTLGATIIMSL